MDTMISLLREQLTLSRIQNNELQKIQAFIGETNELMKKDFQIQQHQLQTQLKSSKFLENIENNQEESADERRRSGCFSCFF
jgi:hypothetical protein